MVVAYHAGFTKLHKPVHFAEALNLTKRWMADSSPDYRGAEYTLVRPLKHGCGKWSAVYSIWSHLYVGSSPFPDHGISRAGRHGVAPWQEPECGALHSGCEAAGWPLAAV